MTIPDESLETQTDEPSDLGKILRELPGKKVAFVVLVVAIHLNVAVYLRGRAIGWDRDGTRFDMDAAMDEIGSRMGPTVVGDTWEEVRRRERELQWPRREPVTPRHAYFVPPWQWAADEWRGSIWPWR